MGGLPSSDRGSQALMTVSENFLFGAMRPPEKDRTPVKTGVQLFRGSPQTTLDRSLAPFPYPVFLRNDGISRFWAFYEGRVIAVSVENGKR